MESYCIICAEKLTTRQEALSCHGCDKWQHCQCQTGITREQYLETVTSWLEVIWRCMWCIDTSLPDAESTRLDKHDVDAFDILPSFDHELSEIKDQDIGMATTSWYL